MSEEKQRLFFALWPDDATREAIARAAAPVLEKARGNLVAPENLHITMAFLHNVAVDRLPCIRAAAARATVPPFQLTLERIGFWRRARILWLAPERQSPRIEQLFQRIWTELGACDFEPEYRPFRPHVTLARKALFRPRARLGAPVEWSVREFALVQSLTGRPRSEYRVLDVWPLR